MYIAKVTQNTMFPEQELCDFVDFVTVCSKVTFVSQNDTLYNSEKPHRGRVQRGVLKYQVD